MAFTERGAYFIALIFLSLLYPRAKKNSKIRWMILGYLMEHEGAHYREILASLKIANGSLAYHLRQLEIDGMVSSRNVGMKKVFALTSRARKSTSK
jgi:predicted transcriptional regulator